MLFTLARPKLPNLTGRRPMPDLHDYMTTEDAAKALGFHIESVRRMLRDRELDGMKVGYMWFVAKKSVAEYKKQTEGLGKFDPRRGNH